jgi:hypothetical protein
VIRVYVMGGQNPTGFYKGMQDEDENDASETRCDWDVRKTRNRLFTNDEMTTTCKGQHQPRNE